MQTIERKEVKILAAQDEVTMLRTSYIGLRDHYNYLVQENLPLQARCSDSEMACTASMTDSVYMVEFTEGHAEYWSSLVQVYFQSLLNCSLCSEQQATGAMTRIGGLKAMR